MSAGIAHREIIAPLFCFVVVNAVLELTWWHAPFFAEVDSLPIELGLEISIFVVSVAVAGFLLRKLNPSVTQQDRQVLAIACVTLMWAIQVAMVAIESLVGSFTAFADLSIDSVGIGFVVATLVLLLVLVVSQLYYGIALWVLHFVVPAKRIAQK